MAELAPGTADLPIGSAPDAHTQQAPHIPVVHTGTSNAARREPAGFAVKRTPLLQTLQRANADILDLSLIPLAQ